MNELKVTGRLPPINLSLEMKVYSYEGKVTNNNTKSGGKKDGRAI